MEEVQNVTVSNNAAEATVQYKRIDVEGGYMTDIDEIENFKSVQRRDVINNYMLGDFNDVGDYIISEKVLSGLVSIKKTVSNEYNNMIFLKSVSEFSEKNKLEFCIVVKELTDNKQGYATAIMKLLEPVNKINGYITNTNSFIVASFTDVNDDNFIAKVKRVFGVVDSNDTNGKDDPKVVADILNRITFLRHCKDMSISVFMTVEGDYYHGRLEILKQNPEYEEVLKKYRSLILKANMFLDPASPQYHAYMNELLDQAIDNAINENPDLRFKLKRDMKEIDMKHNGDSKKFGKDIADKAKEMMEQVKAIKTMDKAPAKKVEDKKVEKKAEASKAKAAPSKADDKKSDKGKGKPKKKTEAEDEKKKDKLQYVTPQMEHVEIRNANYKDRLNKAFGNTNKETYKEIPGESVYKVDNPVYGALNQENQSVKFIDNNFTKDQKEAIEKEVKNILNNKEEVNKENNDLLNDMESLNFNNDALTINTEEVSKEVNIPKPIKVENEISNERDL